MADQVNLRQWIIDAIKPALPATWKLVSYNRDFDTLDTVAVTLAIDSIERTPAAPQSHRDISYVMQVIDPRLEPEKANAYLDDEIMATLDALDKVPNLAWKDAKRGLANGGSNLGFEITLTFTYQKEA